MSLLRWFMKDTPKKTLSVPPFPSTYSRPLVKAAQGHWFLQLARISPQHLIDAWLAHAAQTQHRWLIIDPLSRFTAIPPILNHNDLLLRFTPTHLHDIPRVLRVFTHHSDSIDAILILDLERLHGLWDDGAQPALWDQFQHTLHHNIPILQLQVLDWGSGPDDTLTPVEDLLKCNPPNPPRKCAGN